MAGHIFEVTQSKERVWSYQSPFQDKNGMPLVYRAYRVPPEWLPEGAASHEYTPWSVAYGE